MTFATDIETAAGSEPIEAVVIGEYGWGRDYAKEKRPAPAQRGVILLWAEARPMLDYPYDTGFGGAECDAIWAWTPTRVLFVHEYDGATGVRFVPRNPRAGAPEMSGNWSDD